MTLRPQRLLQDSLIEGAQRTPDKEIVVTPARRYTYGEFLDASLRLATAMQGLGLERGDRVVIYVDNTTENTIAIFATLLAGGVFVVVNAQTKEEKLAYILDDSGASLLVTESGLSPTAAKALAKDGSVRATICVGEPDEQLTALDLDKLIADNDPSPRPTGVIPLDLAALIYTSGSTGEPKGVMMTHQNMVFAAGSIAQYLRLEPSDRIICLLPLAFDYGLYQLLMSVRIGGTLVLERSFAFPTQALNRVEEEQVTVFPGVPTVFATLLAMRSRRELPAIRSVTNTAAALPPAFHDGLKEFFPNALIFRMYGLTECKRVSYLEPELLAEKPTSVGKAIPGTETMVLRADGTPVEPGETGVLHVRGPHVMAGYWRMPDLSAHMLKDGTLPGERILCTHDLFRIDEDGFLYFVGRSDDIIKTRGEKVSPIEVENALYSIEGVKEAAVIGIPDELLGEAIRAYVVLQKGVVLTDQEIIRSCRAKIENFMVPKEVVLTDELPRTDTGKIRKKGLAAS